jgi:hypothetical protein
MVVDVRPCVGLTIQRFDRTVAATVLERSCETVIPPRRSRCDGFQASGSVATTPRADIHVFPI